MQRDFAGAVIGERDYARLRASCRLEAAFPVQYSEWLALVCEGTELAAATGYPSQRIDIAVDEFLSWCATAGVHPCLDSMRAFLIMKRHGLSAALSGVHRGGDNERDTASTPEATIESTATKAGYKPGTKGRLLSFLAALATRWSGASRRRPGDGARRR
jgi:hypothetical protein